MNYKKCLYFVEGKCEAQLINALKAEPRLLTPGKVSAFNVIKGNGCEESAGNHKEQDCKRLQD